MCLFQDSLAKQTVDIVLNQIVSTGVFVTRECANKFRCVPPRDGIAAPSDGSDATPRVVASRAQGIRMCRELSTVHVGWQLASPLSLPVPRLLRRVLRVVVPVL